MFSSSLTFSLIVKWLYHALILALLGKVISMYVVVYLNQCSICVLCTNAEEFLPSPGCVVFSASHLPGFSSLRGAILS